MLAPTGTIGLLIDCDTTGVEPDLGLVKTKKLVGGGTMSIVNQTIPRALAKLGYGPEQCQDIVRLHQREHVDPRCAPHRAGAPAGVRLLHGRQHHPLLGPHPHDGSGATLHQRGHLQTVNMPEDVTVEDVEQLHIDAWRLGIKAVAIYRDNCKVAQPLSTTKKEAAAVGGDRPRPARTQRHGTGGHGPHRRARGGAGAEQQRDHGVGAGGRGARAPARKRNSKTFSFRVADCEGYVTVGEYEDGRPGEVFIKVSKQGSTLAGIMDAFSIRSASGCSTACRWPPSCASSPT